MFFELEVLALFGLAFPCIFFARLSPRVPKWSFCGPSYPGNFRMSHISLNYFEFLVVLFFLGSGLVTAVGLATVACFFGSFPYMALG